MGFSSNDELQIENTIGYDLETLSEWSQKWLMSFNPNKTEIMIFSNREIENINFHFNGNNIPISDTHRHLGITFSNDAKWNDHVNSIIMSASKHINVLRKLKYTLNRNNLEKIYFTYIRPIFEYASEIWDNCGDVNSQKLERLQLEAARIVSGLPIFTKSETIYNELGWESLAERRTRKKLQLFYNIIHGNAPNYLNELIPPTIQSISTYPLRNGSDIMVPFCRLSTTYDSFIPSTIREWNALDPSVRNIDTASKFKNALKREASKNKPKVPTYYSTGPRRLNVLLTQLRCNASFLNWDLSRVNIINDSSCQCGFSREDSHHYFFDCPIYIQARRTLIANLEWLPAECTINLNLLTCGNNDILSVEENNLVFKRVYDYIKKSKRFLLI